MSTRHRWIRRTAGLTVVALLLGATLVGSGVAVGQGAPVRGTLSLPAAMIEDLGPAELVTAGSFPAEHLYARNLSRVTHIDLSNGTKSAFELPGIPNAIAGTPSGDLLALDNQGRVHVYTPEGLQRQTIRVAPKPTDIAMLSDGTIVAAGVSAGKLLHLFDATGKWLRSFGEANDDDKGTKGALLSVMTDGADVYLVRGGLEPSVRRFSSTGQALSNFTIETDAVALQRRASTGRSELKTIMGAAFDSARNRLVFAFAGSTETPLLEEFSLDGQRESSQIVKHADDAGVSSVDSVAVSAESLFMVTKGKLYQMPRAGAMAMAVSARFQRLWQVAYPVPFMPVVAFAAFEECPGEQEWGSCVCSCAQYGSAPQNLDCRASAQSAISFQGFRIIGSSCTSTPQNCTSSGTLCNLNTGVQSTHSASMTCDPCSSGGCPPGMTKACQGDQTPGECSCCTDYSPIVIDTGGDGLRFSNARNGVLWDINGMGFTMWVAWPRDDDDAWLFLDRDGNGAADSGAELFGNTTQLADGSYPEHGYLALAELDANHDGWISMADPKFQQLRLWHDRNRNGQSEPSELVGLLSDGILALSTDAKKSKKVDQHGNKFAWRARVRNVLIPTVRFSYDVFPVTKPVGTTD